MFNSLRMRFKESSGGPRSLPRHLLKAADQFMEMSIYYLMVKQ